MRRIMLVVGSHPEAIKLAPVIKELEGYPKEFEVITVTTAQHRQMLDQALGLFKITPSYHLDIMEDNQTLSDITARIEEASSLGKRVLVLRDFTEFPLFSLEETVDGADCLVLLVDHKKFKGINVDALLKKMRRSIIIDTRGIWLSNE